MHHNSVGSHITPGHLADQDESNEDGDGNKYYSFKARKAEKVV